MSTLKKIFGGKKTVIYIEKTKIMMSGKRGKKKKEKWKWGNKELEEVQEFKYLGFNLDRKGDYTR